MTSIWTKAIKLANNFEELDYIAVKLETTSKINRRTKAGRAETNDILQEISKRKGE